MSMTTQEMYDKVVNHMRAQGFKGPKSGRGWGYINPDNPCERCAKGILMDVMKTSEGNYVPTFSIEASSILNRYLTLMETHMLNDLEELFEKGTSGTNAITANYWDVELSLEQYYTDWESGFKYIANKYNLLYTQPNKELIKQAKKEVENNV